MNEAALLAARAGKKIVDDTDFELAKDKVLMGPEKTDMHKRVEETMDASIKVELYEIFGPRKNLTVQLGFWLKIIFVLGYIVFMIVEIRNRVKERKQERSIQSSQPDLLDDF